MFILRRFTKDGQESNEVVGDYYNLVQREISPKSFEELLTRSKFAGNIFALIVCKKGSEVIPLYENSTYYMMLSNGETFTKLAFS